MATRLYQLKKQNFGVEIGNSPLNSLLGNWFSFEFFIIQMTQ